MTTTSSFPQVRSVKNNSCALLVLEAPHHSQTWQAETLLKGSSVLGEGKLCQLPACPTSLCTSQQDTRGEAAQTAARLQPGSPHSTLRWPRSSSLNNPQDKYAYFNITCSLHDASPLTLGENCLIQEQTGETSRSQCSSKRLCVEPA